MWGGGGEGGCCFVLFLWSLSILHYGGREREKAGLGTGAVRYRYRGIENKKKGQKAVQTEAVTGYVVVVRLPRYVLGYFVSAARCNHSQTLGRVLGGRG